MSDIRIRYQIMPCSVHAFTVREDVGSYDVYINPNISHEAQLKAYQHEVEHIEKDDFSLDDVSVAEGDD